MRLFRAEQGTLTAAAAAAALYALTMARTVGAGDSGELILAAEGLGIAHPPGYALWLLFARLAAAIPIGTVALRVNALSALATSAAAGLLWLLARRAGLGPAAAAVATIFFATASIVWSAAVEAEVYGLASLSFLALSLLAVRARRARATGRDESLFFFVAGIALVVHQTLLFPALAWSAWVLARGGGIGRIGGIGLRLARGAAWAAAGVSVTLVIPVRWSAGPDFAWTDVRGLAGLGDYFLRRTYGGLAQNPLRLDRVAGEMIGMGGVVLASLGWLAAALACVGLAVSRRARPVTVSVLAAALTIPAALAALIAFTPDAEHLAQVAPFLAPVVAAFALLAGSGAESLARRAPRSARLPAAAALVAAAIAFVPGRYAAADRSDFTLAERYGRDLLASAPPGAALILDGDNETFLAAYAAREGGFRRDVILSHRRGWIFGDPYGLRGMPRSAWTAAAHRAELPRIRRGAETLCYATPPADLVQAGVVFTQRGLLHVAGGAAAPRAWELPADWPRSSALLGGSPGRYDYVTRKMAVAYSDAAARWLWARGRTEEALPWFLDAARVGHDVPAARLNAAAALAATGRADRAVEELFAARRLAPDDPEPSARIAVLLASAGRPGEAAVWFERAFRIEPDAALAADAARAWSLAGNTARAGTWSRRAASLGAPARAATAATGPAVAEGSSE